MVQEFDVNTSLPRDNTELVSFLSILWERSLHRHELPEGKDLKFIVLSSTEQ